MQEPGGISALDNGLIGVFGVILTFAFLFDAFWLTFAQRL